LWVVLKFGAEGDSPMTPGALARRYQATRLTKLVAKPTVISGIIPPLQATPVSRSIPIPRNSTSAKPARREESGLRPQTLGPPQVSEVKTDK